MEGVYPFVLPEEDEVRLTEISCSVFCMIARVDAGVGNSLDP